MWGLLKPIFKPYEYWPSEACCCNSAYRLRYWNLTSLKTNVLSRKLVATVLTVYGIETFMMPSIVSPYWTVATVLTVYGIETSRFNIFTVTIFFKLQQCLPFTVLKLIIHTMIFANCMVGCNSAYRLRYWNDILVALPTLNSTIWLQQCLPFTVLKLHNDLEEVKNILVLQQCLPFTVLKQ